MEKHLNISLDVLRICACIGVIMIHAAGCPEGAHWIEPGTSEWNWCASLDALSRWTVPVFAMLSGFLFLEPQKELPLSKLYGKYIARIVVAQVFWSCFYAITIRCPFYPFGILQGGHFWYLGMLIGLYMAMPIMRLIAKEKRILSYFCYAWLFCKAYFFMGNFVSMPFDLSSLIFVDYVGYALWAYYLSTIVLTRKWEWVLYGSAVLGLVVTIIGYIATKDSDCCYAGYVSVPTIITSFGLFYLFLHHNFNLGARWNKVIQTISECTFGIYLLHMWMLILVIYRLQRYISTPVVVAIISVVVAFVGGLFFTLIIKRIPFLKKWIV